jgi:hypothetical protein
MFLLKTTYELWEQNRAGLSVTEPAKIMGRILKIAFGSKEDSMDSFLEKSSYLYSLPRIRTVRTVNDWTLTIYNVFETEEDGNLYELTRNKYVDENAALLGYKLISESVKSKITAEELEILIEQHIVTDNPYSKEKLSELRAARNTG